LRSTLASPPPNKHQVLAQLCQYDIVAVKLRSYGAAMKVIGNADKHGGQTLNWPMAQQSC